MELSKEFNDWWNADKLTQTNPFEEDTPAFWAWEGWQAALASPLPGTFTSAEDLFADIENRARDNCELCHGEKGGVLGNENIVGATGGIKVCDYCHADGTADKALEARAALASQASKGAVLNDPEIIQVFKDCGANWWPDDADIITFVRAVRAAESKQAAVPVDYLHAERLSAQPSPAHGEALSQLATAPEDLPLPDGVEGIVAYERSSYCITYTDEDMAKRYQQGRAAGIEEAAKFVEPRNAAYAEAIRSLAKPGNAE